MDGAPDGSPYAVSGEEPQQSQSEEAHHRPRQPWASMAGGSAHHRRTGQRDQGQKVVGGVVVDGAQEEAVEEGHGEDHAQAGPRGVAWAEGGQEGPGDPAAGVGEPQRVEVGDPRQQLPGVVRRPTTRDTSAGTILQIIEDLVLVIQKITYSLQE